VRNPSAKSDAPAAGPGHPMGRGPMPIMKVRPKNTKGTLLRIWSYLGHHRSSLILVFILTALAAGLGLIGPFLIGYAIDHYIIGNDMPGLIRVCVLLLAIYCVTSVITWFQAFVMTRLTQKTVWSMRGNLFADLQQLPLRFFDTRKHGEIMSRLTNDMENVANSLNQSVVQLISGALTVIGTLIVMLVLDVYMTLIVLVTVPIVIFGSRLIAKFTRKHFTAQQKELGELNGYIEETVSGQKVVVTYGREKKVLSEFKQINDRLTAVGIKAQIFSGMMGPVMNMINNITFAIVAFGGGWLAIAGLTSVGMVASFITYSRQFGRPINELANQYNVIQAAIAGAERVFEIMDTPSEYVGDVEENGYQVRAGEVEFRDVHFAYKEGEPTLQDVNLTAKPGQMIALVGPTGAGKTTIVNLLTRFYEIDQGSISIDGVDIRERNKNELRSQLGIVLQDAYLFSGTVRDNIRYGRPDASDEEVEEAARLANADSFIQKMAHGYDSEILAEGTNISQGQRQLLTIARAMLANHSILILDEATSSIDTRTEMHITQAMRTLMKGRTSFVIAHRLSTIREADQILVVNEGRIIERGSHEQLLAQQGFYAGLYQHQYKRAVSVG
jgi:ATP-binding cassette subfamily B multidrug efflux pump